MWIHRSPSPQRRAVVLLVGALCVACVGDPAAPDSGDSAPDSDHLPDLGRTQTAFDGDYFWFARESIEAASQRVHLVEYMLYDGTLTGDLLDELLDAAARGVEVKVLADEEGDETSQVLSRLESESGGAIATRLDSSSTTPHHKLIIADGVALVGSHNFSDSALGWNNEASMYLVEAGVVDFYEDYFQALWSDSSQDPALPATEADGVVPIANRDIADHLLGCMDGAQQELRLVLYALSYRQGEANDVTTLLNHLIAAWQRGVDVQVVLDQSDWIRQNGINDEAIDLLLDQQVPLRLSDPDTVTHAKAMRCDQTVIVGDANWSYSSMELYNGTSVQVTRGEVADSYEAWFLDIWDEGEEP